MMFLFTIGKTKNLFFKEAIAAYVKKIRSLRKIEVYEVKDEAALLKALKKDFFIIVLEPHGKQFSSEELALFIKKKELEKDIAFVLGDENGLGKEIEKKANVILSFSRMTFPHELARVMVLEQVYRALSINANLPYHK